MGQRVSLGQVRPRKRRVVRDMKRTSSSSAILPTFEEEDLQVVDKHARRTMNEGLYINRGMEHTKAKLHTNKDLHPVPEESLPGIPQASEEVKLEETRLVGC